MSDFADGWRHVRVPATSANLGPGFDSLGLALDLQDDVAARVTDDGLRIDVEGEGGTGALGVPRDETHLVIRAMRRTFDLFGVRPPGVHLACVNRIPHGRGLGSSAAAIVAGILLARELIPGADDGFGAGEVLTLADAIEGHPDNVAACLLGGLTIAWSGKAGASALRCEPDPSVAPVALVPAVSASTELARGLLPEAVPHRDAAFSAARAALLVAALTTSPDVLLAATEDRLHQSYRAAAMPDSARLMEQLRDAGHPAVISGAGPTVLALARGEAEAEQVAASAPEGWRALRLAVEGRGALANITIR